MTTTPRHVLRLSASLVAASLPAVLLSGAVARAGAMWALAEGAQPYWVPSEGLLLYGLVPVALLSAVVLFLAPGLLLALAAGRATTVAIWLLSAVPFSLLSAIVVLALSRSMLPAMAHGILPGLLMLGCIGVSAVIAKFAIDRRSRPWPFTQRDDGFPLALAGVGVTLLYLVLAPKFLWENFNGDGAHAFEISRLLLRQPWPFFPERAGVVATFPGTTSMLFAFPNAWFIRLFGPIEAAVRLPFLLYLPLLALGIQALAEEGGRRLERSTVGAIWLGLMAFVFAMAFSASYSPYHADIALPAVQDTLLLVVTLGFLHAMVRREWVWAASFGLLMYVSLPSGLLLMGFWLLAELAVVRPRPWRAATFVAITLAGCMVAAGVFVAGLGWSGQPLPGGEYGLSRTIADVLRIDPTNWRRAVYVLVGGAIFPVCMLFAWRRQDEVARRVTAVVLGYFLFFSVQARFSLHHMVPAMLLPLVVAVRLRPESPAAALRYRWMWQGTAVAALLLSLPESFAISTSARRLGMAVAQQVGSYEASDPSVFEAADLLGERFPADWDPAVPTRAFGGSALPWLHYAVEGPPGPTTNYVLSRADSSRSGAMPPSAASDAFRLDVLDEGLHQEFLGMRPPANTDAWIYRVPRSSLFGSGGPNTVDLAKLLRRLASRVGLRASGTEGT
ncbi:MAG: hypothetical protein SFU84_03375 [Gemmatimonadales bacterium]|nr:hypothetical protein [Gemmatimonadales bacterium]